MTQEKKMISKELFERIVRESCEHPFAPEVIITDRSALREIDYLNGIWWRLKKYIGHEDRMLGHQGTRSEAELLRDEIVDLVQPRQDENYDIRAIIHKHITAALDKHIEGE